MLGEVLILKGEIVEEIVRWKCEMNGNGKLDNAEEG
jgi:hypothetical protein